VGAVKLELKWEDDDHAEVFTGGKTIGVLVWEADHRTYHVGGWFFEPNHQGLAEWEAGLAQDGDYIAVDMPREMALREEAQGALQNGSWSVYQPQSDPRMAELRGRAHQLRDDTRELAEFGAKLKARRYLRTAQGGV
jgi:hypothetical protein